MFHLTEITVHDRSIDHRVLMRPHNEIRYLAGGDEASEAIHVSKAAEDSLIMTYMLAEHGGVGEARADECCMDARPIKS